MRLPSLLPSSLPADRRRRALLLGAQGLVLTGVVGGTAAYAVLGHDVELVQDGRTTEVTTFASSVGDLLAQQDVEVGEHDALSHALDAGLSDGDRVVVSYGRQLTVVLDGVEQTYWTTARSVDDALEDLRIRADGAQLSASRSASIGREGLDLEVSTPKDVTVLVDGASHPLTTTAGTVADVLAELEVEVRPADQLSVPAEGPLVDGLAVKVTRMDTVRATEDEALPAPVEERRTEDLFEGETRVEAEGSDGRAVLTYDDVLADGQRVHRTLVSEEVAEPAKARVVLVGTKERPAPAPAPARSTGGSSSSGSGRSSSSSGSGGSSSAPEVSPDTGTSADGLNWAALAACESGGDPSIVSSNGLYHGLYQFSASTWRAVGGSGVASDASPDEQTMRAKMLYDRAGAGQWPSCGPRLFS